MAWCKTDLSDFFRWNFFLQKCLNFRALFQCILKQSPVYFGWGALVPLCWGHCALFDILSSFFSETKCKEQPKKIQGNVLLLNRKAHTNVQALLKVKQIHPKKSLRSVLHQAIHLALPHWPGYWIPTLCHSMTFTFKFSETSPPFNGQPFTRTKHLASPCHT